jgi:glycosyltransferase involved in cell wall biosynthesis
MKVLMLSTSDMRGGAAKAAYRLQQGFLAAGVDSQMLVQEKTGNDRSIIGPEGKISKGLSALRPSLDMLPQYIFRNSAPSYSTAWFPDGLQGKIQRLSPDIIHLHWINKGFIKIESLGRFGSPLVWTLHDMWPMTGGCHYDRDCVRYEAECGNCPILGRSGKYDLSYWNMHRKQLAWKDLNLTIACPSQWMAGCAAESSLFKNKRIEVIPNGIDLERFRPIDRQQARDWLRLPKDRHLILFSAVDPIKNPHKGFPYFRQAMQIIKQNKMENEPEVVLLGASRTEEALDLPFRTHFLGVLKDELSLALAYAAVDVFAAPSVQDNLPQTVMESLACGTPTAAFRVGGIPEMIDHMENGFLAGFKDSQALAYGIEWILENSERYSNLSAAARLKAQQHYDIEKVSSQYVELYQDLIMISGKTSLE